MMPNRIGLVEIPEEIRKLGAYPDSAKHIFGTARRKDIFPEALPCLVSVNGNTVLVECKDDTCSADERWPLKLDGELFA